MRSGYSAKTADPSTSLRFGRDDKGTFRRCGDLDGRNEERLLREDCGSLHFSEPRAVLEDDPHLTHFALFQRQAPSEALRFRLPGRTA
jgi:hypothetical protein